MKKKLIQPIRPSTPDEVIIGKTMLERLDGFAQKAKSRFRKKPPTAVKGEVTLIDGEKVPDFVGQFKLPITTHRPHKWAMMDMEDGNVWILDPECPPNEIKFKKKTKKDIKRIQKIANKLGK